MPRRSRTEQLPRFPISLYRNVPPVLQPWNPRHHWLLLTWLIFRPGALRAYLYQAIPDLYYDRGAVLIRALRRRSIWQFLLTATVLTMELALVFALLASFLTGEPLSWFSVAFGVMFGVAIGAAFCLAIGMVSGVAFGVASGVAFGTAFGVVAGVTASPSAGVTWGVAIGMAFGVLYGVVTGVAVGVVAGIVYGVLAGAVAGMAWGVADGVAVGLTVIITCTHLLFYPFNWFLAQHISQKKVKSDTIQIHWFVPAWDELVVFPLPGVTASLTTYLQSDFQMGLAFTHPAAANPFQRWSAQRALTNWLKTQESPLLSLYMFIRFSQLEEYFAAPLYTREKDDWLPLRQVLLNELAYRDSRINGEGWVWQLTRRWRARPDPHLGPFCALLADLYQAERTVSDEESLEWTELLPPERYEGVRPLPGGAEIADAFAVLRAFLLADNLESVAQARPQVASLHALTPPLICPGLVSALLALGDIGAEVAFYHESTNRNQQAAALNRANGSLQELYGYIETAELLSIEQWLLDDIIANWQALIAQAQGELGRQAIQAVAPTLRQVTGLVTRQAGIWQKPDVPFANPYIAGDPVRPPLFVGRQEILSRMDEIWRAKKHPDSIILYGHRRMGKSSILRNLQLVAPPDALIVYADLSGETSFVESTQDFLANLAEKVTQAARQRFPDFPWPDSTAFASPVEAQRAFNRLTAQLKEQPSISTIILALDEFEALELAVQEGHIQPTIYQFLRSKTQEEGITMVMSGLHTLDEMSRAFQQPFYGSYTNILVTYLEEQEARKLITNPTEDFPVNYEQEAVEQIFHETGGHPYLVQLVCRNALNHLNHELFDLNRERAVRISIVDVEAAMNEGFFQRGTVYFDGVWAQINSNDQRHLLRVMAQQDTPWQMDAIGAAAGLDDKQLHEALYWAKRHDVLWQRGELWGFHVRLFRRWIQEQKN